MPLSGPRTGGSAHSTVWAACSHELVGMTPDKLVMQVHGSKVVEIIEVRVVWTNLHEVHGIFDAQVSRRKIDQARTTSLDPGDVLSADVEQRRFTSNCKHANAR